MSDEEESDSGESPAHKRPRMEKRATLSCPENDSWILLSQGAEARVWKVPKVGDGFVVIKERFSKAYRHPSLDEKLTKRRCRMEARLLEKCKKIAPLTHHIPQVLREESPLIHLEYIDGVTVKQFINENSNNEDKNVLTDIASEMGRLIGTLHTSGLMVHGDLTTSNLLIVPAASSPSGAGGKLRPHLYLIDFGLAKPLQQNSNKKSSSTTTNLEEMAVDLYVLERALQSTHPQLDRSFWESLVQAYVEVEQQKDMETNSNSPTLQRLEQVRLRGRKRDCFG